MLLVKGQGHSLLQFLLSILGNIIWWNFFKWGTTVKLDLVMDLGFGGQRSGS